jgi:hypothetical protein
MMDQSIRPTAKLNSTRDLGSAVRQPRSLGLLLDGSCCSSQTDQRPPSMRMHAKLGLPPTNKQDRTMHSVHSRHDRAD